MELPPVHIGGPKWKSKSVLDDDDGGGGEGGGGSSGMSSGDSPGKKDEDKDKNKDKDRNKKEKEKEKDKDKGKDKGKDKEKDKVKDKVNDKDKDKDKDKDNDKDKDKDVDREKDKEKEQTKAEADAESGSGGSACRLRGVGSRSSLSLAGPLKPVPIHRPNKPCCFCWCCCCTCSWNKCQSILQISTCLAVKGNNSCRKRKESGGQDQASNCEASEPPPTLEEIRCWGNSFDKLMRNPAGRKVFREFLRCEYSEENILFWLACEELKREGNPDVIEEKARFIYEDYISILSPKEVSLDSRVREIVNRNMVSPTPHTFDEAQLQIYTLMHRDSYPRFVNSSLYKKLAQIHNGEGSDVASGAEAKSSGAH